MCVAYQIKEFEGDLEVVFGAAEGEVRAKVLDFPDDQILNQGTHLSETVLFFTSGYHLLVWRTEREGRREGREGKRERGERGRKGGRKEGREGEERGRREREGVRRGEGVN